MQIKTSGTPKNNCVMTTMLQINDTAVYATALKLLFKGVISIWITLKETFRQDCI